MKWNNNMENGFFDFNDDDRYGDWADINVMVNVIVVDGTAPVDAHGPGGRSHGRAYLPQIEEQPIVFNSDKPDNNK